MPNTLTCPLSSGNQLTLPDLQIRLTGEFIDCEHSVKERMTHLQCTQEDIRKALQ
jgi:hypothetical protein